MTISARNPLAGTIEDIVLGSVMAHGTVRVGDNIIESVITRRSAEEMALKKGSQSPSSPWAAPPATPLEKFVQRKRSAARLAIARLASKPLKYPEAAEGVKDGKSPASRASV